MKTATATTSNKPLDERANLGLGLLVAESEDGTYEPVAAVGTVREAREIAQQNFRTRLVEGEKGLDVMLPTCYVVWQQGPEGGYRMVSKIELN